MKYNNPPNTTTSLRVKLPSNLQTLAPTKKQKLKTHTHRFILGVRVYTIKVGIRSSLRWNTILKYTIPKIDVECTKSSKGHSTLGSQLSPGNLSINAQPVTQHNYLTKMANANIDEDTGVAM